MHKKALEEITLEQAKEFIDYVIMKTKDYNEELYDEMEMCLYKKVYGCHFNEWLLKRAIDKLVNEDGTYGGHWTLEETDKVAHSYGIEYKEFNKYDFNYVMNMIYSDYYGVVPNEVQTYVKMAKKFLLDKDGKSGKALCYFLALVE